MRGIPELCLLLKRTPLSDNNKEEEETGAEDASATYVDATPIPLSEVITGSSPFNSNNNNNKHTNFSSTFGGGVNSLFGGMNNYNFNTSMFPTKFNCPPLQKDMFTSSVGVGPSPFTSHYYYNQMDDRNNNNNNIEPDPFGVRGLDTFGHSNSTNCCTPNQINNSTRTPAPQVFVGCKGRLTEDMHLFANIFSGQEFEMDDLDTTFGEDDNMFSSQERSAAAGTGRAPAVSPSSSYDSSASSNNNDEGACENVFPLKLHYLLQQAEKERFEDIISWVNDGAAFKVHDPKAFLEKVMPNYFDQSKYESFRRQLNLYGFQRVARGSDRGIYYHQFFLKSAPTLCHSITRPSSSSTTTTTDNNNKVGTGAAAAVIKC